MEDKQYDEIYEVLDEFNASLEEIVNEYDDPEIRQHVVATIQAKTNEFLLNLQEDLEKLDLIEMTV